MSKSSIIALSLGIISIISVVAYIAYDMNKRRDTVTLAKGATIPARSPETVSPFGDVGSSNAQSTSEQETINGIPVPPMPDETLNNSTVAGIDVNANGVRDDVERKIAEAFGNDKAFYERVVAYNVLLQRGLVSPTKENALAYVKSQACFGTIEDLDRYVKSGLDRVVVTTKERGLAHLELLKHVNLTLKGCSEYQ